MPLLLIVAGDPSGDLYGSLLIQALKRRDPALGVDAVGGPRMSRALQGPDIFLFDLASLGVTGFIEPIKKIPAFLNLLQRLKVLLKTERPDGLVCIDFYGFNRRVLALAKQFGIPAFYFISPQVWASRPGRVKRLKTFVERMFVIFPFEAALYEKADVPVTWVGHPLLDILPEPRKISLPETPRSLRIGLLPGSRFSEVRRHMPVFAQAARQILRDFPKTEFLLFAAHALPDAAYAPWMDPAADKPRIPFRLVRESDYRLRAELDFALTSSGTATLENALLGIPMVVVYKLSWPTYLLARALIQVPYIAMANLLAGKKLVEELIQHEATPNRVTQASLELLGNPRRLLALRKDLVALRGKLGGPGATNRTAEFLIERLKSPRAQTLNA